jgi:hypothetical protein
MSEGEKKALEKRLGQYIREIDRCIALLGVNEPVRLFLPNAFSSHPAHGKFPVYIHHKADR